MSHNPARPPGARQDAFVSFGNPTTSRHIRAMGGLPAWPGDAADIRPDAAAAPARDRLAQVHAAINRLLPPDGAELVYLPTGVTPGEAFAAIGQLREEARDEIDRLLAFLDATDCDLEREEGGDAEPSLGWTTGGAIGAGDDQEGDGPATATAGRPARRSRTGEGRRHG